jgi:hypothetical protein
MTLAVLTVYLCHWYLATKTNLGKRIRWLGPFYFRYFWNLVLFLTFLPTATSGVLLYLGYRNWSLVNWHNQLGIVMVIVGFLHLLARIRYLVLFK